MILLYYFLFHLIVNFILSYKLPYISNDFKLLPIKINNRNNSLNSLKENYYYCGENKTCLITGASRGIGRSIAKTLAKSVSKIICISKSQKSCDNIVDELKSMGSNSLGYSCDLSNKDEITETINKILTDNKNIDILVNNAGITRDNLFIRMKPSEWNDVINTNLNSLFYITQPISKRMIKNKYGRIINISSIVGITGNIGQLNYASSKAGIIGFTKTLAKELGTKNITSNAIAPGFIQSDMTNIINEDIKKEILSKIPAGRMGTPEEIANLVAYLSSEIAGYINGKVFIVDGGMTT